VVGIVRARDPYLWPARFLLSASPRSATAPPSNQCASIGGLLLAKRCRAFLRWRRSDALPKPAAGGTAHGTTYRTDYQCRDATRRPPHFISVASCHLSGAGAQPVEAVNSVVDSCRCGPSYVLSCCNGRPSNVRHISRRRPRRCVGARYMATLTTRGSRFSPFSPFLRFSPCRFQLLRVCLEDGHLRDLRRAIGCCFRPMLKRSPS